DSQEVGSYVEYPSIGKFEGRRFDPRTWRPQTPTEAYMELRDDDAFWAAQRVAAFTDEQIRAAVHTGQFSNPAAEKYLADVLIEPRNTTAAVTLTAVNPVVSPRLDANNQLTFERRSWVSNGCPRSCRPIERRNDRAFRRSGLLSYVAAVLPGGQRDARQQFLPTGVRSRTLEHATWTT